MPYPSESLNDYPRRILVAVTGLSPQIVTETLYALAVAPTQAPFVPTEIHLITTRSGAEKARLALLSDEPGWFHHLCQDYALPAIRFNAETIHVLEDADGQVLEDIRSPDDNRHAADGITEIIREFTADPDCALHVSIAGGRKTMGFFLGYALSLYGRPQDKLSHVLVSEPFESSIGFYYPTPASHVLELPGGRLADTASAQVTLAVNGADEIPGRKYSRKHAIACIQPHILHNPCSPVVFYLHCGKQAGVCRAFSEGFKNENISQVGCHDPVPGVRKRWLCGRRRPDRFFVYTCRRDSDVRPHRPQLPW